MTTEEPRAAEAPEPVECTVTVEAAPEIVFPFFTDPVSYTHLTLPTTPYV